ncbi:KaiC domain-containing protein [Halorubrum sp. SS7]|uniref:KaiC domain-containing protein n=1 Tax=Halorubrum sp. SS7 TaxID=2518119 RepID=UPI0010FA1729|nr:KaiC domain-containing protein [Halorubrum sp. SS7]TKX59637.1 KaiC domain-containing protein [Halorubrum sp. SS7]
MSEEDDWFERALRETDEESDERPVGDAEGGSGDAEGGSGDDEGAAEIDSANGDSEGGDSESAATDYDDPAAELGDLGGGTDSEAESGGAGEAAGTETDDAGAAADDGDPFGGAVGGDGEFGGEGQGGPSADDGVPADAFGDLDADEGFDSFGGDDPFGGGGGTDADGAPESNSAAGTDTGSGGGDSFGADDPFGGSRRGGGGGGGGGPSGAGGGGAEAGGDPFGGYRGAASAGDDDFGFGDLGGDADAGGPPDFDVDPDEFESEIARTDIGIEGLDDMILGGVPKRSLLSVIGGAGTGKTTFALQFLNSALESGGKAIYITLEQTRESIFDTATEKGWSFREYADEDRLAVVAIDPIEMANSLSSIRNDLVRLISEFDADRLVLDSVSLLEMMYDHPAKRRSEVFGFTRSLKESGVTTLLTSEASEDTPYASRHGIVEYLTDAVFVLQYVRGSDFRETRLAVEIQKIRDANHSRETKPYDITDTGISVYDQANIF